MVVVADTDDGARVGPCAVREVDPPLHDIHDKTGGGALAFQQEPSHRDVGGAGVPWVTRRRRDRPRRP